MIDYTGTGETFYYYHNDHLGTPQRLSNEAQDIVWEASYTPFGEANISVETVTQSIRFPGQYFDRETSLHYNGFRYYDPKLGRYITSDPIGLAGGINTYGYALQNPVGNTDPLGLNVYVCGRPADLPFPLGMMNHEWLLTDTAEAGMGAAGGGIPAQNGNSDYPDTPVEVVDHKGESTQDNANCDKVENVDEECVEKMIKIGTPLGSFGPTNNCQTYVMKVIIECSK